MEITLWSWVCSRLFKGSKPWSSTRNYTQNWGSRFLKRNVPRGIRISYNYRTCWPLSMTTMWSVCLILIRLIRDWQDLSTFIGEIQRKGVMLNILSPPSFAGVKDGGCEGSWIIFCFNCGSTKLRKSIGGRRNLSRLASSSRRNGGGIPAAIFCRALMLLIANTG